MKRLDFEAFEAFLLSGHALYARKQLVKPAASGTAPQEKESGKIETFPLAVCTHGVN